MSLLICKSIEFLSQSDEDQFFKWLQSINSISDVKGIKSDIHISVKDKEISDDDLREIIAIFTRYKIDLAQLAQFKTKENCSWFFNNKDAYWHKSVF